MPGGGGPAARHESLFAGRLLIQVLFEDIERVSMVVLHADGTQDRAHGTRCTSLFPNDFPHISRSNTQPQYSAFFAVHSFNDYSLRVIHQSLRDLGD